MSGFCDSDTDYLHIAFSVDLLIGHSIAWVKFLNIFKNFKIRFYDQDFAAAMLIYWIQQSQQKSFTHLVRDSTIRRVNFREKNLFRKNLLHSICGHLECKINSICFFSATLPHKIFQSNFLYYSINSLQNKCLGFHLSNFLLMKELRLVNIKRRSVRNISAILNDDVIIFCINKLNKISIPRGFL